MVWLDQCGLCAQWRGTYRIGKHERLKVVASWAFNSQKAGAWGMVLLWPVFYNMVWLKDFNIDLTWIVTDLVGILINLFSMTVLYCLAIDVVYNVGT
jgi:hypothetical protein